MKNIISFVAIISILSMEAYGVTGGPYQKQIKPAGQPAQSRVYPPHASSKPENNKPNQTPQQSQVKP